jgi:hypothetical protein
LNLFHEEGACYLNFFLSFRLYTLQLYTLQLYTLQFTKEIYVDME